MIYIFFVSFCVEHISVIHPYIHNINEYIFVWVSFYFARHAAGADIDMIVLLDTATQINPAFPQQWDYTGISDGTETFAIFSHVFGKQIL